MSSAHNYAEKVVLVTGASSGLGQAIAIHFARLGARLAITGRDEARLKATCALCLEGDPNRACNIHIEVADLSRREDARTLIENVVKHYGRLDVLVNNAAKFMQDNFLDEEHAIDVFDQVVGNNLRSVFMLSHFAAKHLIHSRGAIVNISSANGLKPFKGATSHCIAKAGVSMLTRALGLELGPKGVRVNSVNPAQMKTPQVYAEFGMKPEEIERLWNKIGAVYPLGRVVECEEVAKVVAFLASSDASYVNGAQIQLDGGFLDSLSYVFKADAVRD